MTPPETPYDLDAGLAPESPFGRWGPLFLVVPLLTLVIGIVWSRRPAEAPPAEHAAPPPLDEEQPVPGWRGEQVLSDGSRLIARLTPLNALPRHQAFDAWALGRRFDLEKGQPWRLFLARERIATENSGPAEAPAVLSLTGLHVTGKGSSLEPPSLGEPNQGRPHDPVQVLLSASSEPLEIGRDISLVLWGETPEDPLFLELPQEDAGAGSLDTGSLGVGNVRLELMPDQVDRDQVVRSLARLEADADSSATLEGER